MTKRGFFCKIIEMLQKLGVGVWNKNCSRTIFISYDTFNYF